MYLKHWLETTGWVTSEHLDGYFLASFKSIVQFIKIISIIIDEMTTIDRIFWVEVHVYIVESQKRVPHLLRLSCVVDSGMFNYLIDIIM